MALMKNKSVAFNVELSEEKELLEYCDEIDNFSNYVKELIFCDMKKHGANRDSEDK